MKRILIASLAALASAAAFAQTPSGAAPVPAQQHHSSKHHQKHSQHRSGHHGAHHSESVADRAMPLDSAVDFKP